MIKYVRKSEDIQINVTPMIDLMIFLIVFFLSATTFSQKEKEHDVLLPSTRGSGSLSKALEKNLIINVKKDGTVLVEGRKYSLNELQGFVTDRRIRSANSLKVKIRADARTPYATVASTLSMVERAGVPRAFMDTKEEFLEP